MYDKIVIIIFCICIFSVGIISVILSDTDFSNNENRYLKKFPTFSFENLLDKSYTADIEEYVSDHIAFRDKWISLKTGTEISMGKKDNTRVYFGKNLRLYQIHPTVNEQYLKENVDSVNNFCNWIKEKYSIPTSLMIVPTANLIYKQDLPDFATVNDEEKLINQLYSLSNLNNIDIIPALKKGKQGDLYFKLDHHWTQHGAYLAYLTWCKQQNIIPYTDYEIKNLSSEFYGTLFSKANYSKLVPDHLDVYIDQDVTKSYRLTYDSNMVRGSIYEYSNISKKDKYTVFLDGNHATVKISSSSKNGKKLLVIKDSYAHAIIPFLAPHYEEIMVLDLRYINASIKTMLEEDYTDCLILYNLYNFAQQGELQKINS